MVKFSLYMPQTRTGSGDVAPLILNLTTRSGCVVSHMPQLFYPQQNSTQHQLNKSFIRSCQSELFGEEISCHCRVQTPHCPACNLVTILTVVPSSAIQGLSNLIRIHIIWGSQDSTSVQKLRLQLQQRGVQFLVGQEIFLSSNVKTGCETQPTPIQVVLEALSMPVQQHKYRLTTQLPSSAEVKNEFSNLSTPPHTFTSHKRTTSYSPLCTMCTHTHSS
jgi:hypothetical protein